MTILETTKFLMKKYNITASKSLGQNFLIAEEVVKNTVLEAKIKKEDLVIEIGPGLGTLTEKLAENAGKVICVELDKKMVQILQDRFYLFNNIEIINEDVLKLNLDEIIEKAGYKEAKIVANLPYYITTPIIMKLLESKAKITSITVMVQKEVADRLCAKTGTRKAGAITYAVEYYADAKELFVVSNSSFIPAPNIESAVISLTVKQNKFRNVKDEEKLFELIKCAFMQRRKTLINAMQGMNIPKEKAREILNKLGISEKIRGEALTLEEFIKITEIL